MLLSLNGPAGSFINSPHRDRPPDDLDSVYTGEYSRNRRLRQSTWLDGDPSDGPSADGRPEYSICELRSRKPDIEAIIEGDGGKRPDLGLVYDVYDIGFSESHRRRHTPARIEVMSQAVAPASGGMPED